MASTAWSSLDHAGVILDFSKLLIEVAKHSATIVGGAVTIDWVKGHINGEKRLRRLIGGWKELLGTLSDEQKATLERQRPGVVEDMETVLNDLDNRLAYVALQLQSTPLWRRLWLPQDLSLDLKSLAEDLCEADRDFTATTQALYRVDPVAAVLGADAASTALNIEMANLPATDAAGELPEAPIAIPQPAATPTGVRSATSGTLSTRHQLPPDVLMAYRSTVATTAALLPAILRGGPRPRAPVLPV